MSESRATQANLRKRRGVAKFAVTRLVSKVSDLEASTEEGNKANKAKQLQTRLKEASDSYEECHLALIDSINATGEDTLQAEQVILDAELDIIQDLSDRLQTLINNANTTPIEDERKIILKKLKRLGRCLSKLSDWIRDEREPDKPHLTQFEEQLLEYKIGLSGITDKTFSLDLEDTDECVVLQTALEGIVVTLSLGLKKMAQAHSITRETPPTETVRSRLPRLDVPTFDGNLLNWRSFWEQFKISVHDCSSLSNSEKLVYLQQALKAASARNAIEGLSRTGENYEEAVQCLEKRYDRPRLIHQAHVKSILDSPSLKEGTGKELRKLHDNVVQHLRALKAMGYDPSGPFITSALELKLDQTTMFEWHRHSETVEGIPHYQKLLDFLDSRAQATECTYGENGKRSKHDGMRRHPGGFIAAHFAAAGGQSSPCVLCQPAKHPLYACPQFKQMSHDAMVDTLKTRNLCMNCLAPNHFVKQCKSAQRCKRCQRPHHTLLHVEATPVSSAPALVKPSASREEPASVEPQPQTNVAASQPQTINPNAPVFKPIGSHFVSSNPANQISSNALMMTCRVVVSAPDGSRVEARALLDNASSASFISERLAQSLRLSRHRQSVSISGVAGITQCSSNQAISNFSISPVKTPHTKLDVTALVVPKVTRDLPFAPVTLKEEWNHLHDLELADPDFGHPCKVDLLLGVDTFVDVVLNGRRKGPPGSPIAFETLFGWVLAGSIDSCSSNLEISSCHVSCATGDDILRKFWEIEEAPLSVKPLSALKKNLLCNTSAQTIVVRLMADS